MAEYISRAAALKAMDNLLHQNFLNVPDSVTQSAATAGYMDGVKDADIRLRSIPAADVRPVVLCKDCYAYRRDKELAEAAYLDPEMYCGLLRCEMGEDSFCSYGKRKEES